MKTLELEKIDEQTYEETILEKIDEQTYEELMPWNLSFWYIEAHLYTKILSDFINRYGYFPYGYTVPGNYSGSSDCGLEDEYTDDTYDTEVMLSKNEDGYIDDIEEIIFSVDNNEATTDEHEDDNDEYIVIEGGYNNEPLDDNGDVEISGSDNEDAEVPEHTDKDEFKNNPQNYIEYDMQPHETSSPSEVAQIYAHYPLLGDKLLSEDLLNSLHYIAKACTDSYLNNNKKCSLTDKQMLTLAVVTFAKDWDYIDENKFWRYIAAKLGHESDSTKLYSFLTSSIRDTLQENNRLFISDIDADISRNEFKTTIMTHALAPKSGWLALCDFLYEFYCNNMEYSYKASEPIIAELVTRVSSQLKSNDEINDSALHMEGQSYYLRDGLRKLLIYRPKFMSGLIDYMLGRIHALLENKKLPVTRYIDNIIDEWHIGLRNSQDSNDKNIVRPLEAKRVFSPKYIFQNNTKLVITCPSTQLSNNNFTALELNVYIDEKIIDKISLSFYDTAHGRVLKEFTVNIATYMEEIHNELSLRLVVRTDATKTILDSGNKLYRQLLCFKGDMEVPITNLQRGGYIFYAAPKQILEIENTIDEQDIAQPYWNRVVYANLGRNFKVFLNDELVAYDEQSTTNNATLTQKNNLINLTRNIAEAEKGLADIPIHDECGEKWPVHQYMWMNDIDRRTILSVSYPTGKPCELWVGKERVAERRGKRFALGEAVAKYSSDEKTAWSAVFLRREAATCIIAYLSKKERFIKPVSIKYSAEKNAVYWNKGGGFVGENNDTFRLILTDNNAEPIYDEKLDLDNELVIPAVDFLHGIYRYKIVKQSDNIFADEDITICEGQTTIGNEDALRFQHKRVKIQRIIRYYNGRPQDLDFSTPIKTIYIDNIDFLHRDYLASEEDEFPVYSGVMFCMNGEKRYDFSYAEYTKDNQTSFYKVNPIKITCISNNKMIVNTEDGDGIYFYRKYNKKKNKNTYRIVDTSPNSAQKDDYDFPAYFLYTIEEE